MALIGQTTGLIVLFLPEQQGQIETISSHVGALLLMALTAYGYIQAEARIDAQRAGSNPIATNDSTQKKSESKQDDDDDDNQWKDSQIPILRGFLLAMCFMFLGGCAASFEDRWYQAQDTLNTLRTSILIQHRAGNITDRELVALDQWEKAAREALGAAKQLMTQTDPASRERFEFYIELVDSVLDRLIQHLEAQGVSHERTGNISPDPAGESNDPDWESIDRLDPTPDYHPGISGSDYPDPERIYPSADKIFRAGLGCGGGNSQRAFGRADLMLMAA